MTVPSPFSSTSVHTIIEKFVMSNILATNNIHNNLIAICNHPYSKRYRYVIWLGENPNRGQGSLNLLKERNNIQNWGLGNMEKKFTLLYFLWERKMNFSIVFISVVCKRWEKQWENMCLFWLYCLVCASKLTKSYWNHIYMSLLY